MQLLDFQLPPFARTVYASKALKEEWEPKIGKVNMLFHQLERLSVVHGLRKCTTEHISPNNFETRLKQLAEEGLIFIPIQAVGQYNGFASSHPPVVEGKPWNYYGVVSNSIQAANEFVEASYQGDHRTLGRILGYPECCIDSLHDIWMKGYHDPVWQQSINVGEKHVKKQEETFIRLKNNLPWESNPMLRYIGIRIIPHIPCSQNCKHSQKMAEDWLQLAKDLNLEGIEEATQLLQMPIEWDCLKGIAYISTPIFKIETNSNTCYPKYIVQREGDFYPKNAPRGLKFPWNNFKI